MSEDGYPTWFQGLVGNPQLKKEGLIESKIENNIKFWRITDKAKKRFKGLNFRTGNILNLPYDDNSFEAVLAVEVLEHIPNLRKAIKEMSRVSSKYIIFTVPHKQKPRKVLCPHCLKKFYAEGHINYFDDDVIKKLSSENNLKLLKQRKINIIPYLNFELYPEIIKRIMNSLFIKFSAYFIAVLLKKESK